MCTQKGVSHAARRDDEGLNDKRSKNKSQNEGDEQRIDGFLEGPDGRVAGR